MFRSLLCCLGITAVLMTITSAPSKANLFGIKHVEPTPLPAGQWNFTSQSFSPYTGSEDFGDVSVYAQCRYVAPKQPYEWQFTYKNLSGHRMSFDMGLVQINNGRLATVAQIYTDVEVTSVRHAALKPHGTTSVLETGRYGCPGMEGGVNKSKHYLVILDNVTEDNTVVRRGVFAAYDSAVNEAHYAYNAAVGATVAQGMSDGFNMINNEMAAQQTMGGE